MHKIKVDATTALVDVTLHGMIGGDESKILCAELKRVIGSLRGRPIKILVDAQFLQPVSPEVVEEFLAVQKFGRSVGLDRVAQVVESSVVLLQRTRVMRESGTDPMTRTFRDLEEARRWLLGPAPHRSVPASVPAPADPPSQRPPPASVFPRPLAEGAGAERGGTDAERRAAQLSGPASSRRPGPGRGRSGS